ncbi:MAG TPA: SAM-dependent methyltransferase [Kineosporiaceae bacterium]
MSEENESIRPKIPYGPTRPNPARIYDYWLGGKDNYACDRDVGDQVALTAPWAVMGARASRAYLRDSVLWLAGQGIDQFIDIGSGLPTAGNVHQIAQRVNEHARVIYVDHDPVVLAHARALMADDPGVLVLEGDLCDPMGILADVRRHSEIVDLGRPVAVLLSAIIHFISDVFRPERILRTLREALASGSYFMISQVVADDDDMGSATRAAAVRYSVQAGAFTPRTTQQIVGLFEGLEIVKPGICRLRHHGRAVPVLGGIGRRP